MGLRRRLARVAALVAVAGLVTTVGACGAGDDDVTGEGAAKPVASTKSDSEAITALFYRVRDGFFDGNGRMVCDGLTDRAQRKLAQIGPRGSDCLETIAWLYEMESAGKPGDPKARIKAVEVRGDTAVATLVTPTDGVRTPARFIKQQGAWLMDTGILPGT
jgi:hypothetical protein